MRAAEAIRSIFYEAANIDRGWVAVELELLIRNDLGIMAGNDDLYADGLVQLAASLGFNVVTDASVTRRPGKTFEYFYQNCELNNAAPDLWSKISPKLAALLTWLKRTDVVTLTRGPNSKVLTKPVSDAEVQAKGYKRLKLPRGRVPANASAGVHIHFDVETWFGGVEHAQQFLAMWNAWKHNIPGHLPASRYNDPTNQSKANRYATVDQPTEAPTPFEVTTFRKDWERQRYSPGKQAREYFGLIDHRHRYYALNTMATLERGDLEFRFIHGTLNFETIEGWVRALAELIEFTRKAWVTTTRDANDKFNRYLDKEAPDTAQFLHRSKLRHRASRDPLKIQGVTPPRTTRRMFKVPAKRQQSKLPGVDGPTPIQRQPRARAQSVVQQP